MKKLISVIMILVLAISLAACGGKASTNEIPDVFGVNYTDAIGILEAEGFEVTAIESSVGSFSDKLLYPLEKVDKGTVFKIDEYILDNNGNLNKNYDVFYDEGLVSSDKSVVIYYAKEDYELEKKEPSTATMPATEAITHTETAPPAIETAPDVTEGEKSNADDTTIDPDFKAAMDSYEKFFDEYVAIMKKYKENPTDMSILTDYAKYMGQYADMMQKLEDWENEDLNAAETAYYVDVQARITKKLLEIA